MFQTEAILGCTRRDNNSWDFFADREKLIAQVRITSLGHGARDEFANILRSLQDDGMRGLILDLRWCPGGYLDEAVGCADLLLGDCKIATLKDRSGQKTEYTSTLPDSFLDFPIIVLVNGETSGGAELIAAALQDNKRARVSGQRTFGKGSVQRSDVVGGMKITTGVFLRPSGKNMNRFSDSKDSDDWGVLPDRGLDLRISPPTAARLKEWWLLQTLRPGSSKEALPLDDPAADPQRQLAVDTLLEMLKR